MRHLVALCALALAACGPAGGASSDDDFEDDTAGGDEGPLPDLRRIGLIAPGEYLFDGAALGTGDALHPAFLVAVEPDSFTVAVDGAPHRSVARSAAWPMACLTEALEYDEGSLALRLRQGAPVFVLSASADAARISAALHSEHSVVVPRRAIQTAECEPPTPAAGQGHLAAVAEGNVPCLFPDQETLDEGAGLPIPSGAAARAVAEEGEWTRARVFVRGGTVEGWMGGELFAEGAASEPPRWTSAVLGRDRCVFPGRPEAREWEATSGEVVDPPTPTIPAIEIERVVRNGRSQIQACYEPRLSDVPDLTVQLEVLILVDADGHVSDVDITRGESADAALSRCVVERVRRWRFPPPRSGTVNVRHTFELRPPP